MKSAAAVAAAPMAATAPMASTAAVAHLLRRRDRPHLRRDPAPAQAALETPP